MTTDFISLKTSSLCTLRTGNTAPLIDLDSLITANAIANMFISWQMYEGLKITAYSLIEAVKFLLQDGMEYVLSEKFCQDPCEEYFGVQRSLGRRCDNPDLQMFGYNDNAIRIQRHISSNTGNTRGRHNDHNIIKWCDITDDKLERRKRK